MSEELDSIGILLNFENNRLEERWRRHLNAYWVDLDLIWTAGLLILSIKIALFNWELIKDMPFVVPWILCGHTFYAFVLFLQCRHRAMYINFRIPLTLILKLIRDVSVGYYVRPVYTALWPPLATSAGPLSSLRLFFRDNIAMFYVVTCMFTMCAPLKIQLPTFLLAVGTVLSAVPDRCTYRLLTESSFPTTNSTSNYFLFRNNIYNSFDILNRLWVFNIGNSGAVSMAVLPVEDPWLDCVRTQCMHSIIFGVIAPLIAFSSVEEHWRLKWHAPSGRSLLRPPTCTRIVHDAALFIFGCAIACQAISLVFFLMK